MVLDIVVNGRGVISSYFEWVQNHTRLAWAEDHERCLLLDRLAQTWGVLTALLSDAETSGHDSVSASAARGHPQPAVPTVPRRVGQFGLPLAVASVVGVTAAQARWVSHRYGNPAVMLGGVDVTVSPTARSSPGLPVIEVAAFGDSGMAGVGVAQVEESIAVQLARRVADGLGHPVHVVGHARPGARTGDVLAEQVPRAGSGVDLTVLMVGTNDVTHGTSPWRLAANSAALLNTLTERGPVVMASLPEFRAMTALPHPLIDAAVAIACLARTIQARVARRRPGVVLVDVRAAVGHEFVADPGLISTDGFHPGAAGYARIADALTPAMISAARQPRPRTARRPTLAGRLVVRDHVQRQKISANARMRDMPKTTPPGTDEAPCLGPPSGPPHWAQAAQRSGVVR